MHALTSIEICAGAGGQALGLEQAGFKHAALVEIDPVACQTLRTNRPTWNVRQMDLQDFAETLTGNEYGAVDLLAGGVPCPPFSVAGAQLGHEDERDLFPTALELARRLKPRAVLLENVRGLLDPRFDSYRRFIIDTLYGLGLRAEWALLNACDFGVPQLRPRAVCVALPPRYWDYFTWPKPPQGNAMTVGEALSDLMGANGWPGAHTWKARANRIAPTIVGGSRRHGGPDLGPTRARQQWQALGVDGIGIADAPPTAHFPEDGRPKLTVRMVARLQGFPDQWCFSGRKTAAYRQVGNAFPPPVARAVGRAIRRALLGRYKSSRQLELLNLTA
jgi:DNA (cytosine-5)-methyltransferase 1